MESRLQRENLNSSPLWGSSSKNLDSSPLRGSSSKNLNSSLRSSHPFGGLKSESSGSPGFSEYIIYKTFGGVGLGCIEWTSHKLGISKWKVCEIVLKKVKPVKFSSKTVDKVILKGSNVIKFIGNRVHHIQLINPTFEFLWNVDGTTKYSIGVTTKNITNESFTINEDGLLIPISNYKEEDFFKFYAIHNQIPFS